MKIQRLRLPLRFSRLTWALCMVCVSSGLMAQTVPVPDIGDALRQLPSKPPVQTPESTVPRLDTNLPEPPMAAAPQGGPRIEVKQFALTGNQAIPSAELLALIAGAAGQSYSLVELEGLARKLTYYYRQKGYFVARVYVPEQTMHEGVLTLRVIEGSLGKFKLDNQSLVSSEVLSGVLERARTAGAVSVDTLERALLILQDTPGAQVIRADVLPGELVGQSDFAVGVQATPRLQGYVSADNYGSRYTGSNRVSGSFDWNSPTGRGDRLSAYGLSSTDGGLLNGRLAYSALLHPSGWRGEAALSRTTYDLGDTYAPLDAKGTAQGIDLGATYPLRRTQDQSLDFGLNLAQRQLRDEQLAHASDSHKASQSAAASLNLRSKHALLGVDGTTQAAIKLSIGKLNIKDDASLAIDQAAGGAQTQGHFSKLNANIGRQTQLDNGIHFGANLQWQRALGDKNLDGSERMGISGDGGVAAYPSGEAAGTDATLVSASVGRALPTAFGLQHDVAVFSHWGEARTLKSQPYRTLSDVGLTWSAQAKNGLFVRVQWAHRLSGPADSEPDKKTRLLLQGGCAF